MVDVRSTWKPRVCGVAGVSRSGGHILTHGT